MIWNQNRATINAHQNIRKWNTTWSNCLPRLCFLACHQTVRPWSIKLEMQVHKCPKQSKLSKSTQQKIIMKVNYRRASSKITSYFSSGPILGWLQLLSSWRDFGGPKRISSVSDLHPPNSGYIWLLYESCQSQSHFFRSILVRLLWQAHEGFPEIGSKLRHCSWRLPLMNLGAMETKHRPFIWTIGSGEHGDYYHIFNPQGRRAHGWWCRLWPSQHVCLGSAAVEGVDGYKFDVEDGLVGDAGWGPNPLNDGPLTAREGYLLRTDTDGYVLGDLCALGTATVISDNDRWYHWFVVLGDGPWRLRGLPAAFLLLLGTDTVRTDRGDAEFGSQSWFLPCVSVFIWLTGFLVGL